jgi:hypothetical protein
MAMHRLPAGTEAPRWRLLAAIWVASLVLAVALAFALNALTGLRIAQITAPVLWLAIQWAVWLYLKDRPAHPRVYELEPEPDESPTVRLQTLEARAPSPRPRAGDHGAGRALDRSAGRHSLKETRMSEPNPTQTTMSPDRFAPYPLAQVEAAALALQTCRWNFTLYRPMDVRQASKQFATMNRHLAEQVRKEAFAALTAAATPVWPTADPETSAGKDGAAEVDDFWDRGMELMIDWFNPPDEDAACESIVLDAIERAYRFAESQPCICVNPLAPEPTEDEIDSYTACQRCQVLGRVRDKAVPR